MSQLVEAVRAARETGELSQLVDAIPYLGFIGFKIAATEGELICSLPFAEHLIGNPTIPAIHGGAIGALLESTAIFAALLGSETVYLPKIVTITVDYLRTGRPTDTQAAATITRQGRRVVNVAVEAWQEDRAKPIARANAIFLVKPL